MKYKVGDKVKVREDLDCCRFFIEVCGNMTDTPELMEV